VKDNCPVRSEGGRFPFRLSHRRESLALAEPKLPAMLYDEGQRRKSPMARILLGIVLGVVLLPLAILAWFQFGAVPVAVADAPFPHERQLTGYLLRKRIDREIVKTPPLQPDEDNLLAGAQVYRDQCASCHGYHGKPATIGAHMFPHAPALWEKHGNSDVVGVSDDPPGETFWKVANGIRLSGMPAFKETLTGDQMWQVSLLLANADKPLPPSAVEILRGESQPPPSLIATPVTQPKK
jgi:mono/diheme cytochrome c family protein